MTHALLYWFAGSTDCKFVAIDEYQLGTIERRISTGMRLPDMTVHWGDLFTMLEDEDEEAPEELDVKGIICAVIPR